jgi:hypothetical protein
MRDQRLALHKLAQGNASAAWRSFEDKRKHLQAQLKSLWGRWLAQPRLDGCLSLKNPLVAIVWALPAAAGKRAHKVPSRKWAKVFPMSHDISRETLRRVRGWLFLIM